MDQITIKDNIFPNWIKSIIVYNKNCVQYMNVKKTVVVFKKNMKNCGLPFHCNIIADALLEMCYVSVRLIPCSCS